MLVVLGSLVQLSGASPQGAYFWFEAWMPRQSVPWMALKRQFNYIQLYLPLIFLWLLLLILDAHSEAHGEVSAGGGGAV